VRLLGVCARLQIGGELVELEFPELAVLLDPFLRVAHRRGHERRAARPAVAAHASESGPLEHADVLGHRGQRHVESAGQIRNASLAQGKAREDLPPRRIGERGKGGVERGMVNHVVNHGASDRRRQERVVTKGAVG
jgi:hypothetical protein